MRAGEFLVVLGPSGAGKSTLLRCVNGLIRADDGRIVIDGTVSMSATRASREKPRPGRDDLPAPQSGEASDRCSRTCWSGRMAGHVVAPRRCCSCFRKRDVEIAHGLPARGSSFAQGDVARRPALRRRAAARRHRPRAGAAAGRDPCRRAGGEPRSEDLARRARLSQARSARRPALR